MENSNDQSKYMTSDQAVPKEERSGTARNFTSSPFCGSRWEVVGVSLGQEMSFLAADFEVIPQEDVAYDPMFEMFDPESTTRGRPGKANGVVPNAAPAISDEAITQRLAEQFEEGKKQGFEEGLIEAERIATEKVKEREEQVRIFVGQLEHQVKESFLRLDQEALKLSLSVSRKILATTAELKPEYILEVIRNGLKALGAARPLQIRVSEQDYEFLEVVGLPADLSSDAAGMRFAADSAVQSGCVIETDFGEIDLRLDEMWEKVKMQLFDTVT